jgi:hypothetical protein
MKCQVIALVLLVLGVSFAEDTDQTGHSVVELPRPNSGTFSTEQAENRKSEILSNEPTGKLVGWENPYNGFSIHIHRDDSITIYGSSGTMKIILEKEKELATQSVAEVKKMARSIPSFGGNPAGILALLSF